MARRSGSRRRGRETARRERAYWDVPTEAAWGDWEADPDVRYAHGVFAGRTSAEVQAGFARCVIERADEIRRMPDPVFAYYLLAFRDFVEGGRYPVGEAGDVFTCYLGTIEERLRTCPSRMAPILRELLPSVVRIAGAGPSFGIREAIYGDLAVRGDALVALMRRVGPDGGALRPSRG